MKNPLLVPLVAAALVASAFGQTQYDQAKMQAEYEKKIAKEFVSFGGWTTDYDAARAKAKAEGKLLFTYFSRSYAP